MSKDCHELKNAKDKMEFHSSGRSKGAATRLSAKKRSSGLINTVTIHNNNELTARLRRAGSPTRVSMKATNHFRLYLVQIQVPSAGSRRDQGRDRRGRQCRRSSPGLWSISLGSVGVTGECRRLSLGLLSIAPIPSLLAYGSARLEN